MSTNSLISKKLNVQTASAFADSIRTDQGYYVFAGKHIPYSSSDEVVPSPTDSVNDISIDVYNNMVFGKKIQPDDVIEMIPRYEWNSGTKYEMYDDQDSNLSNKPFFTVANVGSQYHVYKCLYNGGGRESTVPPSGTDSTPFESPSDGYIWKYMYSANSVVMDKFATNEFMPLVVNTSIVEGAVPGSIEVIKVEDSGLGYDNYLIDSFRSPTDLRVDGNPLLYSIGPNASLLNDFYNGCIIYITSGAAQGEYSLITDYFISGDKKIAVLDEPFKNTVAVNDTFEIYPYVYVFDTGGRKQTNCIARAIVSNTAGNSISKIDVLQPGSFYRSANVMITPSNVVAVRANASLRAIISPQDGHGARVAEELGASYAGVSIKFVQNEEVLTTENDFRQVGIIQNPLFANVAVQINTSNTIGNFIGGEKVYEYKPIELKGSVAVTGNSSLVGNGTSFADSLTPGDSILISTGITNHLGTVSSISNNTLLSLTSNVTFSNNNCNISLLKLSFFGYVSGNTAGELLLTNVSTSNALSTNRFVGETSFATAQANTVAAIPVGINGRNSNNFNTFTQLTRFVGTLNGATNFLEDETITQSSVIPASQPSAKFHSFVENGAVDEIYVTNVNNTFRDSSEVGSDGTVTGSNTNATFTITAKYNGELVPDSGQVLYVENYNPISRANTQTETIKIILAF